jgi:predicted CoA-binding protein
MDAAPEPSKHLPVHFLLLSCGAMSTRPTIDDFLAQKRIAFVGLSHRKGDFSHVVCEALRAHGTEVIAVNPSMSQLEGQRVCARVQDLSGSFGGAYVMTPAAATPQVLRDCAEAGIPRVWLHRGAGGGAVSPEAVALAQRLGLTVVPGECALMFLAPRGPHRVHALLRRLVGRHPDRALAVRASGLRTAALIAGHGAALWAMITAVIAVAKGPLVPMALLLLHTAIAPLLAAVAAAHLFRRPLALPPLAAALGMVGFVVGLDRLASAVLIEPAASLFSGLAGNWPASALMLFTAAVLGGLVEPSGPSEPPPPRAHPG